MEINEYLELRYEGISSDLIEKLIAQRDSYRRKVAALECIVLRALAKKSLTPDQMTDRLKQMIESELNQDVAKERIQDLVKIDQSMDKAQSLEEWRSMEL